MALCWDAGGPSPASSAASGQEGPIPHHHTLLKISLISFVPTIDGSDRGQRPVFYRTSLGVSQKSGRLRRKELDVFTAVPRDAEWGGGKSGVKSLS